MVLSSLAWQCAITQHEWWDGRIWEVCDRMNEEGRFIEMLPKLKIMKSIQFSSVRKHSVCQSTHIHYSFMLLNSFHQLVAWIEERETRVQRLSVHVCGCIYLSPPACLWSAANSSISDSRERSASVISADSSKTNGDIFPNMNLWLTLFKIWSGFVKLSEKIHNNMNIFFENFSASHYLFLSLKEHP